MIVRKKNWKRLVLCVLSCVFCASFFLSGCKSAWQGKSFFAMDTVMSVSVDGDASLVARIEEIVSTMEKKLSVTDPSSLVYALNEQGEPITDEEYASLVRKSVALSERTNGAFDVTVYPLVASWGFTTGENRVPSDEELAGILPRVGYEKIHTQNGISLFEGTKIDLGGIAKGYLTDVVVSFLKNEGVKNAMLNFGGNVCVLGETSEGRAWRVAVSSPDTEGYVGVLTVSDRIIVTSGNYERFFERDGVRYGHIIDPNTGRPCDNDLLSVTVVGENGTECDAFSTALFVMGLEKAKTFASENGLSVILIDREKKTHISATLASCYRQDEKYVPYGLEVIR